MTLLMKRGASFLNIHIAIVCLMPLLAWKGCIRWPQLKSGEEIARDTIFGDCYAHDVADVDDPEATLLYLWCIRDRWKLILAYDGEVNRYTMQHPRAEAIQLFKLDVDPHEENNLADAFPKKVVELQEAIENWYPLRERRLHGSN